MQTDTQPTEKQDTTVSLVITKSLHEETKARAQALGMTFSSYIRLLLQQTNLNVTVESQKHHA